MTFFAHMLTVDELYPLWDLLLQMPKYFTIFISLALVMVCRKSLLSKDLSGCSQFLSSGHIGAALHDAVSIAIQLFENTPYCLGIFDHISNPIPELTISQFIRKSNSEILPVSTNYIIPFEISIDDYHNWKDIVYFIDTRTEQDYSKVNMANSFNFYPHWDSKISTDVEVLTFENTLTREDLDIILAYTHNTLSEKSSNCIFIVVGGSHELDTQLSRDLIQNGVPFVCYFNSDLHYSNLLNQIS